MKAALLLITFSFLFIFTLIHKRNGLKWIVAICIYSYVLMGGLTKEKFKFIVELSDWINIFVFSAFFIYCMIKKRQYLFKINWPDRLLLLYISVVVFIPFIFNYIFSEVNYDVVYGHFIPLRLWLVYRIFYYLTEEARLRDYRDIDFDNMKHILFIAGLISGIISIIRFLPFNIPIIKPLIEELWPLPRFGWDRLYGTNGGTNATGNLFAILFILSVDDYFKYRRKKTLFFLILFFICLLLSGSLSSIGGTIIIIFLYFKNYISLKRLLSVLVITCLGFIILSRVSTFSSMVTNRFQRKFYYEGKFNPMPNNLADRLYWWNKFSNILIEEKKIWFGYGPGGLVNYQREYIDANPESFYFRLLNDSGIFAPLIFILIIFYIRKKIIYGIKIKHLPIVIYYIILFYPIAGIANQTLYYGAMLEIFAIILSYLFIIENYTLNDNISQEYI